MTGKHLRLGGLFLFVGTLVVLTMLQLRSAAGVEKIFESTAIIQVATLADSSKEDFWTQEAVQITADEVLEPVVLDLELARKWKLTPRQSIVMLRWRVSVVSLPERDSRSRFSITVRAPDAELTRSIAAQIATEYQQQGNARARLQWEEKIEALNQEIADQKQVVEEKRLLLDQVQREARQKLQKTNFEHESEKGKS